MDDLDFSKPAGAPKPAAPAAPPQAPTYIPAIARAFFESVGREEAVAAGRFRAATDVFPVEPAPGDLPARGVEGLLLSAHRAGGLPNVLAGIGEMVVDDLSLILKGLPPQRRQAARPETVGRWRNPPGRSYAPGTKL